MNLNTTNRLSIQGFKQAVRTNQPVNLEVRIHNGLGYVNQLQVLFNKNGQPEGGEKTQKLTYNKAKSNEEISCFNATIQFQTPGYRTFMFRLCLNNKQTFIKNDGQGEPVITTENYPFFETFVYEENFSTPDWVKGGIMYQIYIDTFNRSNSPQCVAGRLSKWGTEPKWLPDDDGEYRNDRFFGGNLEGVIEKLDYLKELGVTIIYFTPIFKSVSSNRYDTVDYEQIDEMVGDWTKLEELYTKAHEMGMHIVLDCVFNHCNPQNKLYQTQKHLFTGSYWWGYKHLVEFKTTSQEYQELVRKFLRLYLKYCDGIRLDVADSLSDEMLRIIRDEIKQIEHQLGKQIYLLGEVWKHAIKGDWRRFLYGDELDAVMNYQFSDAIYRYVRWGDFNELKRKVFYNVLRLYPKCTIDTLMNPLSTHDIPRVPNILTNDLMLRETYLHGRGDVFVWDYDKLPLWIKGGVYQTHEKRVWEHERSILSDKEMEYATKLQKLAVVMQYTLPGIPSIFAGDELGVAGLKDPFNRPCMPWEKSNNNELKDFYIEIGKIRTRYRDIFAEGTCNLVFADEKICAYKRTANGRTLYCLFNRSPEIIQLAAGFKGQIVFSIANSTHAVLNPYEAMILEN